MKEQKRLTRCVVCALRGAGAAVLSGTVILLIFAWLTAHGHFPEDLLEICVTTAVIAASLIGGLTAVRLQGRTAAVTALVSGAILLLGITVASFAGNGLHFLTGCYVKLLVADFAGSLAGGMLGTWHRPSSRRKKGRR